MISCTECGGSKKLSTQEGNVDCWCVDDTCPRCGCQAIHLQEGGYECDSCCGDPDCELCS